MMGAYYLDTQSGHELMDVLCVAVNPSVVDKYRRLVNAFELTRKADENGEKKPAGVRLTEASIYVGKQGRYEGQVDFKEVPYMNL